MKRIPILIATCVIMSCSGSSIHSKGTDNDSEIYLGEALERIEHSIREEEKREGQEFLKLERSERWAQYQLEDKAHARREATQILREREANAQKTQTGASARARDAADRASQAAAIEESEAKSNLEEKRRTRTLFEQTAKTNSERRIAQMTELSRLKQEFQARPTSAILEKIEEKTFQLAGERSIRSQVYWTTKPKPGAILKYQTKRQRERGDTPLTVGCDTNCPDPIPIGRYFVWATRKGHPTSDMDRLYIIVEARREITITEDR